MHVKLTSHTLIIVTLSLVHDSVFYVQFEMAPSPADSLSSAVDETGLQDIGNFGIFKGLKGDRHAVFCKDFFN